MHLRHNTLALAGLLALAAVPLRAQEAVSPSQKREEKIVVTQPTVTDTDAKAKAVLQAMVKALGDQGRMQRQDYKEDGVTASFFKNQPTGSTDFLLYHHPLAGIEFEDRIELTKKRDIVQVWTPTDGYELTFKGRKELPKLDREQYFRRQKYSLDALVTNWIRDPNAILIYGGQSLVERRQADNVTIINAQNESVTIAIEVETHLPIERTFKVRNPLYKDFDEDREQYSDWHSETGTPVPYAVTRYFNGDTVSQRLITKIKFEPVDVALFSPNAVPIGKHKDPK